MIRVLVGKKEKVLGKDLGVKCGLDVNQVTSRSQQVYYTEIVAEFISANIHVNIAERSNTEMSELFPRHMNRVLTLHSNCAANNIFLCTMVLNLKKKHQITDATRASNSWFWVIIRRTNIVSRRLVNLAKNIWSGKNIYHNVKSENCPHLGWSSHQFDLVRNLLGCETTLPEQTVPHTKVRGRKRGSREDKSAARGWKEDESTAKRCNGSPNFNGCRHQDQRSRSNSHKGQAHLQRQSGGMSKLVSTSEDKTIMRRLQCKITNIFFLLSTHSKCQSVKILKISKPFTIVGKIKIKTKLFGNLIYYGCDSFLNVKSCLIL